MNELNAFRLLDCDPDVTTFGEQPCEIVYLDDGRVREHYPDICVAREHDRELWEVKSESEALHVEFSKRTNVLTQGLSAYGFKYRVVLDTELKQASECENDIAVWLAYD